MKKQRRDRGLPAALAVLLYIGSESLAWAYAPSSRGSSLGDVAGNMFSLVKETQSFLQFLCLASGVGLLMASAWAFKSYWYNPVSTRFSKPMTMLILGLALIVLSFIPMGV